MCPSNRTWCGSLLLWVALPRMSISYETRGLWRAKALIADRCGDAFGYSLNSPLPCLSAATATTVAATAATIVVRRCHGRRHCA